MNIITDFLIDNYILLVMLAGMFIITVFDVYLERSMIFKLRTVLFLILLLVIFDRLEDHTGNLELFTKWRIVLSILCYSLRPTIILMLIFIVSPKISKLIAIPAVLNLLISSTSFFSGIAFTFDTATNHFLKRYFRIYTLYNNGAVYPDAVLYYDKSSCRQVFRRRHSAALYHTFSYAIGGFVIQWS